MNLHRLAAASGTAALAVVLLAGCAAPSSGGDSGSPYAESEAVSDQAAAPQASPGAGAVPDRSVVTTGSMGLTTTEVDSVADQAVDLVTAAGGRVDGRDEWSGEEASTSLILRVPADEYEPLVESLRGLAQVQYINTSAVDVTLEQADLDGRIEALRASVTSLQQMAAQATNVTDLLAVESELTTRQAELQSLESQRDVLDDQVSMSTLDLTISNDELANPSDEPTGFLGGLQAGWNTFVLVVQGLLTAIGFALPGLVVLAIIGAIVFLIVRALVRRGRRRALAAAPAGVPGPAPATPSPASPSPASPSPANPTTANPTTADPGRTPPGGSAADRRPAMTDSPPPPAPAPAPPRDRADE